MGKPKKLDSWDFIDTIEEPNGYDFKTVPDLTRDNFKILIQKHNNLIDVINMLCDNIGITFDDEED